LDGEPLDISGRLLIQIRNSLLDNLINRFLTWDEDVNRSPTPNQIARDKALDWIHRSIKKHIRKGYTYELEFIDG
jgi:hypothetical protein